MLDIRDRLVAFVVATPASSRDPVRGERVLEGIAASPGIAFGVATHRSDFPRALVLHDSLHHGCAEEKERVRDAVDRTRIDLVRLQSQAAIDVGEEHALIFGAHLLLLDDPKLSRLVQEGIAGGRSAPLAMEDGFDEMLRRLRAVRNAFIQERVDDIEDIRTRVFGHMLGRPREPDIDARIVVTTRTTPSLVVELKGRGSRAIVSEIGGATSHGSVLARALHVPAVTGARDLTRIVVAGDAIVVDGDAGLIVVRPTAATSAEYRRQSGHRSRPQ